MLWDAYKLGILMIPSHKDINRYPKQNLICTYLLVIVIEPFFYWIKKGKIHMHGV